MIGSILSLPASTRARLPAPSPLLVVMAAALLLGLVNPFGYRGGGADDWHYLQAARCAVAHHNLCLPTSHWAARLPIVLPVAAATALFGDTRAALAGVAFAHALVTVALFVLLVQRAFGRLEASLAGLALVTTPVFAMLLAGLAIETVELAWAFGALLCLQQAMRCGDGRWAVLAGMLLGVAVMARTTALLLVPIGIAAAVALPALRRFALPVAAGLIAWLAFDALGYGLAADDPLRDWRLALGHAHLPSTQIAAPIGAHESPLFNRHLIAGWQRLMGIHVHWSIDALLNLLADPTIGLTLIAAAGLLLVERRTAPRALWLLAGAGALDAFGLIYALAIDPEPRMFMLLLSAAATIIGVIGAGLWRRGGQIPVLAGLGLSAAIAVVMVHDGFRIGPAEPILSAWAAEAPRTTMIDETTRRAFPFSSALMRLPATPAPGRTRLLRLSGESCRPFPNEGRLVRSATVPDDDGPLVAALRSRHIAFAPHPPANICLFQNS